MFKTVLFLTILFAACNNDSTLSNAENDSTKTGISKSTTSFVWSKEDENEFLSDCVNGAKAKYSEDTAFIKCNCALKQLKQEYANYDSYDSTLRILDDSTRAIVSAKYTKNCE